PRQTQPPTIAPKSSRQQKKQTPQQPKINLRACFRSQISTICTPAHTSNDKPFFCPNPLPSKMRTYPTKSFGKNNQNTPPHQTFPSENTSPTAPSIPFFDVV